MVHVSAEARPRLDAMLIPSRASIKKRSKQFQPITKVWKEAGFKEEVLKDGGLRMTYVGFEKKACKKRTV